jgi:hypothetical protein
MLVDHDAMGAMLVRRFDLYPTLNRTDQLGAATRVVTFLMVFEVTFSAMLLFFAREKIL